VFIFGYGNLKWICIIWRKIIIKIKGWSDLIKFKKERKKEAGEKKERNTDFYY
jgi:hypothetical protein